MSAKADLPIRRNSKAMVKRVNRLTKQFDRLNDPRFLLKTSNPEIRKLLTKFRERLRSITIRFFAGENIDILVQAAEGDFTKAISRVVDKDLVSTTAVKGQIKRKFSTQFSNIVNEIFGRQRSKIEQFKIFANAQRSRVAAEISSIRNKFTAKGKVFDLETINRNWKSFEKRFGKLDTVRFRNGTKFPLNRFLEGRAATTAQETQNLTTEIQAARLGISVFRVSSHGATDSCLLHEGEMVFATEEAKRKFRKAFPNHKVGNWRTVEQLRNDQTHIFKFNCKHRLLPVAIDFMDPGDQNKEIKRQNIQTIPRKINERKFRAARAS